MQFGTVHGAKYFTTSTHKPLRSGILLFNYMYAGGATIFICAQIQNH